MLHTHARAHRHTHAHLDASIRDHGVLVQDRILICDFTMKTMKAMKKAMASPAAMKTMKAMKNAKKDFFIVKSRCLKYSLRNT